MVCGSGAPWMLGLLVSEAKRLRIYFAQALFSPHQDRIEKHTLHSKKRAERKKEGDCVGGSRLPSLSFLNPKTRSEVLTRT